MKTNRKIRYALMGAGNIAQMAVLPAFKHAKSNSELVAIISSDVEKERQLGEKYDVQLTGNYDKLEEVLEAGAIDAVYIATPNSLHKAHALRVAAAGAHVLCEKPLATSVEDGEAVAQACNVPEVVGHTSQRSRLRQRAVRSTAAWASVRYVVEGRRSPLALWHVVGAGWASCLGNSCARWSSSAQSRALTVAPQTPRRLPRMRTTWKESSRPKMG